VLAAQPALTGDAFFLTMADHVFDKRVPQALAEHGCPKGGLARLKFQGSRLGQWLDTLVDDSTNWLFDGGVAIGTYRSTGDPVWLHLGTAAVSLAQCPPSG
jgi:hypothetical protein